MSIGPTGSIIANSVAGTQLAQMKGSEIDRAQHDTAIQQRQVQTDGKAEAAAGIGETDSQEQSSADRDANGRSPWQQTANSKSDDDSQQAARSRDASGQSGTQLDLSG